MINIKKQEIERKFLIYKIPSELEKVSERTIFQNYLSLEPEIRFKKVITDNGEVKYYHSKKSDGDLIREEYEEEISKEWYELYQKFALGSDIVKDQICFKIPDSSLIIECNIVDHHNDDEFGFQYAEIEFPDEESAVNFKPLPFMYEEVTYNPAYKMKNYFKDTRLSHRKRYEKRINKDVDDNDDFVRVYTPKHE